MELFKKVKERKKEYKKNEIHLNRFFKPFDSLSDAKNYLKAPLMIPIIDTTLLATNTFKALGKLGETIINLVFLDFSKAKKSGIDASFGLISAAYFAGCAVVNTLRSLIALITRTFATIFSCMGKITRAIGICDDGVANYAAMS